MKPSTPTRTINALIGDGEQNEKGLNNKKKETGKGLPTQLIEFQITMLTIVVAIQNVKNKLYETPQSHKPLRSRNQNLIYKSLNTYNLFHHSDSPKG